MRALKSRRLVAGRCQHCDREFLYQLVGRPRDFCGQKCRQAEFRYARIPVRIPVPDRNESTQKTAVVSGNYGPNFGDRPSPFWRVVAGPKPSFRCATIEGEGVVEANNRANAKFWREHNAEAACLIKPVNLLGGYKFPDAPVINLAPVEDAPAAVRSSDLKRYLDQIPNDLSVPAFLGRTP
jgi:hypothetical protein